MESTPCWLISLIYCLKNMRIRSGREKVRRMSIRYRPKVATLL